MRIGSGGVMLPHYSPLKVAETFSMLAGLFPGRIDLGIGRAAGTDPLTTFALQRDRRQGAADDFPEQLQELRGYIEDSLPADHPFARVAKLPGNPETPEIWLLGSSPQSAIWAGELGLPYVFADFINSEGAHIAELYRDHFAPSARLQEPRVTVATWAVCARACGTSRNEQQDGAVVAAHFGEDYPGADGGDRNQISRRARRIAPNRASSANDDRHKGDRA
jgi:luciferase family oxidoreductase group 1